MSETRSSIDSLPVRTRSERWKSVVRFVDRRLRALFVIAWLPVFLSWLGRRHWIFDNLTSFVVQYAIAGGGLLVAFLLLRRPVWALAAAIMLGTNLFRFWPAGEPPVAAGAGEPFRVVSANVKTTNRQFDRFTQFVRKTEPDLLLVLETDDDWITALEALEPDLPHAIVAPRQDNFGIALFSRQPFDEARVVELGESHVPTIVARLTRDGRPITDVGTHPLPPARSALAAERNRQLDAVAEFANGLPGEVILMGDLNLSPWSPCFGDLLRESRLADSRVGFGIQPTWPAGFPLMLTPIDHLLVSEGLTVLDREVGSEIGSDHLPVVATIAVRREGAAPP